MPSLTEAAYQAEIGSELFYLSHGRSAVKAMIIASSQKSSSTCWKAINLEKTE